MTPSPTPPVHGRVLAWDPPELLLAVGGEVQRWQVDEALFDAGLAPGDFARVQPGSTPWQAQAAARLSTSLDEGFPRADSDFWRLQRDKGRLYHNLIARARLLDALRRFFRDQGFLEVETPLVVESPGVEVHLAAVPVQLRERAGAPPAERYLITSPEFHMKRLLGGGFDRLFQVAKVFRDGERGGRHRPEFTMLEWYRAFEGYGALMEDCEQLFLCLSATLGLGAVLEARAGSPALDLRPPWRRLTFYEALAERGGVSRPWELSAEEQERVLVERVEPTLGHGAPEILCDYPISMASLARRKPGAQAGREVAERFEVYAAGLELANGFSELVDPVEQRARCEEDVQERRAMGLPAYPMDERYLRALAEGVPPAAGIALGVDRLVMLLLGAECIDEVLTF